MIEIRRGTPEEFNRTIDFLDYVFSKNSSSHDFVTMYPNIYRPEPEYMSNLINLYEDGELKASLLSLPRTVCVGGERLKVYGIGSVACHPRCRGRGFMSALMNYNIGEMTRDGVHMSNLGGKRSRYNHFGYEIAGNAYEMSFTGNNVRTFGESTDAEAYLFRELHADDTAIIEELKAIYESKSVHYEYTRDDFYLRLVIPFAGAPCYAVYSADDKSLRGYAAMSRSEDGFYVREICLRDDSEVCDVLFDFAVSRACRVGLRLGEWQLRGARRILDVGGELSRCGNGMWRIMRWREVIRALLNFKLTYTALLPGELVLDIEGTGKLLVRVGDGSAEVTPTDGDADFVLPGLTAARALTGPAPQAFLDGAPRAVNLAGSWFPLPLTWFGTERV